MIVILDANVLAADYALSGVQFRLFLDTYKQIGAEVMIPELVLREVEATYRDQLEERASNMATSHEKFAKLLSLARESIPSAAVVDTSQVAARYGAELRGRLTLPGIRFLPLPHVDIEGLIARDIRRMKPFGSVSGYRDYLIWHSVLNQARVRLDPIAFVSQNHRDFASDGVLHPDLQADLRAADIATDRVLYCDGLRLFNDRFVVPHLDRVRELEEALEGHGIAATNLHGWLADSLATLLTEEDLREIGAGIHDDVGHFTEPRLVRPATIHVDEALQVSPASYLVRATVEAEIRFSVDLSWSDYQSSQSVRYFLGRDDTPFSWTFMDWENEFTLSVELRIEGSPPRVTGATLVEVEARWS